METVDSPKCVSRKSVSAAVGSLLYFTQDLQHFLVLTQTQYQMNDLGELNLSQFGHGFAVETLHWL